MATVKRSRGNEKFLGKSKVCFNVGFDFSFFRQRLTGSIVYFDRSTKICLHSSHCQFLLVGQATMIMLVI